VRVRHTGIVVSDLPRALAFYRDLLGLVIVKELEESGEYIDRVTGLSKVRVTTVKLAADGGGMIELLKFHSHPVPSRPGRSAAEPGCSHVAFTVSDLDAEYCRLQAAGVSFHSPPQMAPDGGAKVTYCRDPEGTIVELVEVLGR
jgi:catechol 2,3-dioxygenase-like lactoylglutathione lyase family enzyme